MKGDSPSSTETDSGVSEGYSDNGVSTEEDESAAAADASRDIHGDDIGNGQEIDEEVNGTMEPGQVPTIKEPKV